MKINVMAQIKSVKDEKSTQEAELTTAKTEVESVEPVEDNPVAMPTTRRKSVDDNRGNLFLPDTPEPETPSIPKAASTDRRETEQMREKLHIYCFHCRQPTKHAEMPCDLEQYAADWLMYVCGVCGLKAYARKDLKEEEKRL